VGLSTAFGGINRRRGSGERVSNDATGREERANGRNPTRLGEINTRCPDARPGPGESVKIDRTRVGPTTVVAAAAPGTVVRYWDGTARRDGIGAPEARV